MALAPSSIRPVRLPAVAGTFYPDDAETLAADARRLLAARALGAQTATRVGYATSADAGRVVGYAAVAIR